MPIEQKRSIAITIRLTPAEVEELEQTAAALHQTKTAAIAAAIHLYAKQIHQTAEHRPEAAANTETKSADDTRTTLKQPPSSSRISAEDIAAAAEILAAARIANKQAKRITAARRIKAKRAKPR